MLSWHLFEMRFETLKLKFEVGFAYFFGALLSIETHNLLRLAERV